MISTPEVDYERAPGLVSPGLVSPGLVKWRSFPGDDRALRIASGNPRFGFQNNGGAMLPRIRLEPRFHWW
jgi:hypothetical protein